MKIVPAIEEATRETFLATLEKVAGFADQIHLDINDGSFLDFKTVGLGEVADVVRENNTRVLFEVHLMVAKPIDFLTDFERSGAKKVIIQAEKDGELRDSIETFASQGSLVGLAIGPETKVADIEPFLDMIDLVNIMTVNPGKQGQPFLPDQLGKIKDLRGLGYTGEIEVDGGIDTATITLVKEAGADLAVVGHAIVKAEDPQLSYDELIKLI